jgi:hypothetical protein
MTKMDSIMDEVTRLIAKYPHGYEGYENTLPLSNAKTPNSEINVTENARNL